MLECLSLNTRLGWKGFPGTNTLSYYGNRNKFYDTGPKAFSYYPQKNIVAYPNRATDSVTLNIYVVSFAQT